MSVAFVCVLSTVAPAAAIGIGAGPWSKPVAGPVVREFDPPRTRFGPGHLGVDFATAPSTPVRATGDGVVVFAGRVGAGLHVVVRHPGDIRTTASFLATIAVVVGEKVGRGALLGTSGGTGAGHAASVLHFSVRVGATYVDPMLLFTPVDLAAVVHLAAPRGGAAATTGGGPLLPATPGGERSAIAGALRVDARAAAPPPAWWSDARHPVPTVTTATIASEARREPKLPAAPAQQRLRTRAPGSLVAVVAGTVVSVGGLTVARRRRRGRGSGSAP